MAFRWGQNDTFPRSRNATEGVPYSGTTLWVNHFLLAALPPAPPMSGLWREDNPEIGLDPRCKKDDN